MPKFREAAKSEMDSQRELLDSLMGINRNNDRREEQITDYRDERVCKFFLTGMCPNDIFVNTKMDDGPCEKIHSEALKESFNKSKDVYMYDGMIEREFAIKINEIDRVIKKARARVEEEKGDEEINPEINPDMVRIHALMSKIINEAEAAGDRNEIDRAQDLILIRLEELTKEKNAVMTRIAELKKQKTGPDKKLRVCDVCGSFLSVFDSDKRLQDHFLGKQHVGLQYMRDTVDAIRKRREERREREPEREVAPRRGASRSRDRTNRDSRDRDNRDYRDSRDNRDRRRRDSRERDRGGRERDRVRDSRERPSYRRR